MPKGHKRIKGVPELHDELKTRVSLSLTPTAIEGLDAIAGELGISRSELVERIGRRQILLQNQEDLGYVSTEVYAFIEKATQNFPALDLTLSPVNVVFFKERHLLPPAPGIYIHSNWFVTFRGTSENLKEKFTNNKYIKAKEGYAWDLHNGSFIMWQVCQDSRVLEDNESLFNELELVFAKIKREVISRGLQKSTYQNS